jgi:hypothetical protein
MGLGYLFVETATVSDGIVVDPTEALAIVRRLNEAEGIELLAAPRVSMLDGRQARISDGGTKRLGEG